MPLDEAYLIWLYSQVGSVDVKNKAKTYWKLMKLLHEKEFTWSDIEKDGNRAQDGKDLRRQFLDETGNKNDPEWMEMGCSFLEMLIALAFAVAWEGEGTQEGRFWELIDNLGLTQCNDAHPPQEIFLNRILDRVINRDYAENGDGGLFPLQRPEQDQRQVEIWYQANAYLLEQLDRL